MKCMRHDHPPMRQPRSSRRGRTPLRDTQAALPGILTGRLADVPPPVLRIPPSRLALFLDVDGTLAPIAAKPQGASVPLRTRRLLQLLQRQGVALAALSGRPLSQVRRLLYPLDIPLAGSHGAQVSLSGRGSIRSSGPVPQRIAAILEYGVQRLPGVWLERKPAAMALHWRQAPQHRAEVSVLAQQVLAHAPGWQVLEGHCVHEVRRQGSDKGKALGHLMRQPEFAGRWPLAVGDDRTDEDAFKVALTLKGGAIRIGVGPNTAAPWRLRDTDELVVWLGMLLRSLRV